MDWKLDLVAVPVSDVGRAKAFYADRVGFNVDHDHTVNEDLRFVQLTPSGSACSIAIGMGIVDSEPGSARPSTRRLGHKRRASGTRRAECGGERGYGTPRRLVRLLQRSGRQRLGRSAGRNPATRRINPRHIERRNEHEQ